MVEKLLARLKFQTELQRDRIKNYRMTDRTKTIPPPPIFRFGGHKKRLYFFFFDFFKKGKSQNGLHQLFL